MVTAEITILPVGTASTSISEFVAQAEVVLERFPNIKSTITAMGTNIEAESVDELFEVLKEMHESTFDMNAQRAYTVIKIDDRRDKKSTLEEKIESVKAKLL